MTPIITPTARLTVPPLPSGVTWRSYYRAASRSGRSERSDFAGGKRIAMRVRDGARNDLYFLLSDHLGSTALTVTEGGEVLGEMRYKPWGETLSASGSTPTDYRYTGQREEASIGLYYYRARRYDPVLGRFARADTIVPVAGNPIAWDRYAYALNNPIKYRDPSGHCAICAAALMIWSLYNPDPATEQAIGLGVEWFFQLGEADRSFGPDDPLTREIMNDEGVVQFREHWRKSGTQPGFSEAHERDLREGPIIPRLISGGIVYARENTQLALAALGLGSDDPSGPIDPVGGTIGSLDRITVSYESQDEVRFEVYNEMGWSSFLRVPEYQGFVRNLEREDAFFGGTMRQHFTWTEPAPHQPPKEWKKGIE